MATLTIRGAELFTSGRHRSRDGSVDEYTEDDLRQMVAAADQVGFDPPVKIAQADDPGPLKAESRPAFGWVRNLRVAGGRLLGDLTEVPRTVAELIGSGRYQELSAEIYRGFAQGGRTWPLVLKAVALIGADAPPINTLADVERLYTQPVGATGDLKTYQGAIVVTPAVPFPQAWASGENGGDGDDEDGARKDKDAVHYRMSDEGGIERCGSCSFYDGNSAHGHIGCCSLVDGDIAADAVCDLHEVCEAYDFEDDTNGNSAAVTMHQHPTAGRASHEEAAPPDVAAKETETMSVHDPQAIVIGGWVDEWIRKYRAANVGTSYEEGMRAFQAQCPEDFQTYMDQASVDPREAIAGVPVGTYPVGASVIMNVPGTNYRIEPRGAGPDRWVVYAGDDEEDEIASFNTQAAALAYVKGLSQTGSRKHSRYARRYQAEPSTPGVTLDEATRRDFDPSRLAAITRLTAKAIQIQKQYTEARKNGAYGTHSSATDATSLMSWQEAVRGAIASLSTDAAIAGPKGIAVVMRADPAAASS